MSKSLHLALVAALAVILIAVVPLAEDSSGADGIGDGVTYEISGDGTVVTISGSGAMSDFSTSNTSPFYGDATIENVVFEEGCEVTRIGAFMFYGCTALKSVELPASLQSIGNQAFRGCSSLEAVELPSSVTEIGTYAFYGCTSLESVDFSPALTSIGDYAFYNCKSLEDLDLSGTSVQTIGTYAFYGCSSIKYAEFPSTLASIGTYAFHSCSSLETVGMSDAALDSIGNYTFYGCTSLESVDFPSTLTSLGTNAFYNCTSLGDLDLSGTRVATIGNYAFTGSGLTSIELPSTLTSIGSYAFQSCASIVSLDLSGTHVATIGSYAFRYCTSLESVDFPSTLTSIGGNAFSYSSLKVADLSNTQIVLLTGFTHSEELLALYMPDTVKTVEYNGVEHCDSLETVYFSAGLEVIDECAFGYCYSLKGADMSHTQLKSIGYFGFYQCYDLEYVLFPPTFEEFRNHYGGYMFDYCESLTEVDLSDTQLVNLGTYCFANCTSLTSVKLPATMQNLEQYSFYMCPSLETVVFYGDEPILGYDSLYAGAEVTITVYTTGWGTPDHFTKSVCQDTTVECEFITVPKLTYDLDGGTGALYAQYGVIYEGETSCTLALRTAEPVNAEYKFLGWSTVRGAKEAEYDPGDEMTLSGDVTLYAVWESHTATLVYDANGGTGAPDAESATYAEATDHTFQVSFLVPTRDGYEFVGWSTDPSATAADHHPGYGVTVEADSTLTLYAVWAEIHTTTLAYDANGGTGAPGAQSVEDTSTDAQTFVVTSDEPEREGYVFYGWSTSKDAVAAEYLPWSEVRVPCGETLTLYAVWAHEYTATLVFDANGGTGAPDPVIVTDTSLESHALAVPDGVPTREGYAFLGWSASKDATAAEYHHGYVVDVGRGEIVVLYAVWAQEYTFTLSYDANGGSGAPSAQTAVGTSAEDHVFKISSTEPTRSGYEFLGWADSRNAKTPTYQPGDSVHVPCDSSVTLYAVWGQVSPSTGTFTLAFDANGGTGGPADLVHESTSMGDHTFTVPSDVPTREGYVFVGWATSARASSGSCWPGDEVAVPFGSTVTLYAVWVSDSADVHAFTLGYDANGGTGAPASVAYTGTSASHAFTVSSAVPTRDSYEFIGWSTSKDAVTAQYAAGDSFAASGDATLYAVWIHEYTATLVYDANGGTGAPEAESVTDILSSHGFTVSSVEPVREGYLFLGWSTSKDSLSAEYWSGYVVHVGAGETVTLYAVWAHEYTATLVYDANGGTGAPESVSVTDVYDGSHVFTVSSVEPVREGYVFLGWSTSKDAAAAEYMHGYAVEVGRGSTVTLYAVWAHEHTATLVFDANGGEGAPDAMSVTDSSTATHVFEIPHDVPTRDGYTFLGWATSKDAHDAEYWPGDFVHVGTGSNTVLYALWAADGDIPMWGSDGGSDWLWPAVGAVFVVLVILMFANIAWWSRKS